MVEIKTSPAANDAWEAYNTIQMVAVLNPSLMRNEYFVALRDSAYARFLLAFEAS